MTTMKSERRMTMDTQKRYTDGELIGMLRVLASDLSKKPTQREILDDSRLPTHHTFIKRFGSMREALRIADVENLEDKSHTYEMVKQILEGEFGEGNVSDHEGDTIKLFTVECGGKEFFVDWFEMCWDDDEDHEETMQDIKRMRAMIIESVGDGDRYYQATDVKDLILIRNLLDINR